MKKDLDATIKELDGAEKVFQQESELKQVFGNLDNDKKDNDSGMSKIDFNSRLNQDEIRGILVMDELIRLRILPDNISLTRQKKRLSVSRDGLGREEKVRIVAGDRENKAGSTFGQRLKNLFTPQQPM